MASAGPEIARAGGRMNVNVGVLGHVDSGKTSLVRALSTELSTAALDKHPQSRERGITLDLGFSACMMPLPDHLRDCVKVPELAGAEVEELQLTFVDCPGHASLIRTIIGGAQIMDLMLLVIDVTKGIQTQTAECIVIGEITTDRAIVVLNKVDLLPAEERAAKVDKMERTLRKALKRTRFARAPMVAVSASPGGAGKGGAGAGDASAAAEGMDALRQALLEAIRLPERNATGPLLVAADHCFMVKGKGTVLTGTVLRGTIRVNDTVEFPALRETKRVKGLQSFHKPVNAASQGDRVATLVSGLDPTDLERVVIAAPGTVHMTNSVVALVRKIRFFKGRCASDSRIHVTVGHDTTTAMVLFFGARELEADDDRVIESVPREATLSTGAAGVGIPALPFDWTQSFVWQEELASPPKEKKEHKARRRGDDTVEAAAGAGGGASAGEEGEEREHALRGWQWALLHFDRPMACTDGMLVIGSRLDADIHTEDCRLAFFGRVTATAGPKDARSRLYLYRRKVRKGVVDRVVEGGDGESPVTVVIGRGLVQKNAPVEPFVGMTVCTASGVRGVIEGSFGQSGKFRVRFSASNVVIRKGEGLCLRFRRYHSTTGSTRMGQEREDIELGWTDDDAAD